MLAFDQMANIFYFSIEQDDCPHTFITGQIEGLSIFIIKLESNLDRIESMMRCPLNGCGWLIRIEP